MLRIGGTPFFFLFSDFLLFGDKKMCFNGDKSVKNDIFVTEKAIGEMLEWLKRHAWKACKRQKRFGGSNPPLSA